MFNLLKLQEKARRGLLITPHGSIQTPAFMNVATCGAIKGGVSAFDLKELGCKVLLCNTYHLHLRPGDNIIKKLRGLHTFTGWHGPILTDSGGYQVFSLAKLRQISEEGVEFASHINGEKIFMGPEESIAIQSNLGSTIAMAFDECVENPAEYSYAKKSCERTARWLLRCKKKLDLLNKHKDTLNPQQMLFGINQGSTYKDLRIEHIKVIKELDLDGYAIGGLAVGESIEEMYATIEAVESEMPKEKPRYLMGVGTPVNILEAIYRGVDLFDCVMPSRNARHGQIFTWSGIRNLSNEKYKSDDSPIDATCGCPVCERYSKAYIRHLLKSGEMLGMRLAVMHNLYFYNTLFKKIRNAMDDDKFQDFYYKHKEILGLRI